MPIELNHSRKSLLNIQNIDDDDDDDDDGLKWYLNVRCLNPVDKNAARIRKIDKDYVLIKYFNYFMYNQTLHRARKHFCRYYLQSFSTVQKLERHVNDCFVLKLMANR